MATKRFERRFDNKQTVQEALQINNKVGSGKLVIIYTLEGEDGCPCITQLPETYLAHLISISLLEGILPCA